MESKHCRVNFRKDLMSLVEVDRAANFSPVRDVEMQIEKCIASVSVQCDFHKI